MSFIDDCVKFLEDLILGDFNEQQMVSAQLISGVVSLVPVLDQVMDARDISGCIYRINKRGGFGKATLEEKVDLGFAALGVVPTVGSGFKLVFKPLYKQRKAAKGMFNGGVAMVERMLHLKKGGAVRWVKALDWAGNTQLAINEANNALEGCIALLEYIGQSHWWCPDRLERLARDVAPSLRSMRGKLAAPIKEAAAEIRQFMEQMLGEHAAAVALAVAGSGNTRPAGARGGRAGGQAPTRHKTVSSAPRTQGTRTQARTAVSVQKIAYDLYAPLKHALKGLLGEHIAEHHVIEHKGWGLTWNRHDMHGGAGENKPGWQNQYRKINDNEIPLYLCTPSVRVLAPGIDSAWFTNRPRPHQFAIVEAKASMTTAPKLLDLLSEAFEKPPPSRTSGRRRQISGTAGKSQASAKPPGQRSKVMQMSHTWIIDRIRKDLPRWEVKIRGNYTRHVLLVTPLQAADHIRAAEKIIEHGFVSQPAHAQQFAPMHAHHSIQIEFDDSDLDKAEQTYSISGKPKRDKGKNK